MAHGYVADGATGFDAKISFMPGQRVADDAASMRDDDMMMLRGFDDAEKVAACGYRFFSVGERA